MRTINISNARKELYSLADSCIKYNNVINVTTKNGSIVVMSEDDYNSLLETLYLLGIKGVYEDIEEAVNTKTEDLIKTPPWK